MTQISNEDMNEIDRAIFNAVQIASVVTDTAESISRDGPEGPFKLDPDSGERLAHFAYMLTGSLRDLEALFKRTIKPLEA